MPKRVLVVDDSAMIRMQVKRALLAAGLASGLSGCVNKTVLGDRPGYQEVQAVETIAEARKAVQWVEVDLDGYSPDSPEAVAARDGVLVQWARVRDRAEELQARLDGMSTERWSGRDPPASSPTPRCSPGARC